MKKIKIHRAETAGLGYTDSEKRGQSSTSAPQAPTWTVLPNTASKSCQGQQQIKRYSKAMSQDQKCYESLQNLMTLSNGAEFSQFSCTCCIYSVSWTTCSCYILSFSMEVWFFLMSHLPEGLETGSSIRETSISGVHNERDDTNQKRAPH